MWAICIELATVTTDALNNELVFAGSATFWLGGTDINQEGTETIGIPFNYQKFCASNVLNKK